MIKMNKYKGLISIKINLSTPYISNKYKDNDIFVHTIKVVLFGCYLTKWNYKILNKIQINCKD